MLAVPERWVREHTRSGLIPHVSLGRYRRYRREAVLAWLADQERGGAAWRKHRPVPNGGTKRARDRMAPGDLAGSGTAAFGRKVGGYDPGMTERDETPRRSLRERIESGELPNARLVEGDPDVTTVIFIGEPVEDSDPDGA